VLGHIQRVLSLVDQRLFVLSVPGVRRYAQTHGEGLAVEPYAGVLDGGAQALGRGEGLGAADAAEHQGELVAAETRAQVGAARGALHELADQAQGLVAPGMADLPVETLQVVDVAQHKRKVFAAFLGAVDLAGQTLVQVAVVVEAAEHVGDGVLFNAVHALWAPSSSFVSACVTSAACRLRRRSRRPGNRRTPRRRSRRRRA